MSGNYNSDRNFTDYMHKELALKLIYKNLGWIEESINNSELEEIDMNDGIDYVFRTQEGRSVSIQERFRESKYKQYSDFTIRYRRDFNSNIDRRESEFFKIKADYFIYGIVNGNKYKLSSCTDYLKFAVIDMNIIKSLIDNKKIIVSDKKMKSSYIDPTSKVMHIPEIQNWDSSSSFVALDIRQLKSLTNMNIVLFSKGF